MANIQVKHSGPLDLPIFFIVILSCSEARILSFQDRKVTFKIVTSWKKTLVKENLNFFTYCKKFYFDMLSATFCCIWIGIILLLILMMLKKYIYLCINAQNFCAELKRQWVHLSKEKHFTGSKICTEMKGKLKRFSMNSIKQFWMSEMSPFNENDNVKWIKYFNRPHNFEWN